MDDRTKNVYSIQQCMDQLTSRRPSDRARHPARSQFALEPAVVCTIFSHSSKLMSAIHDLFSHSMDMDLMLAIPVFFSHYSVEPMLSTSIFVQIFIIYCFVQPFHDILTSIFFVYKYVKWGPVLKLSSRHSPFEGLKFCSA